jgi:hypothetical protein
MRTNALLFRPMQEALKRPMEKAAGAGLDRYFLTEEQFRHAQFPCTVSPLAFTAYDEEMIVRTIKALGWEAPREVDANSTNCLLNSFANRVHVERYGFHPYAFEIAGIVRAGAMAREEGLKKMNEPENRDTVEAVRARLGA